MKTKWNHSGRRQFTFRRPSRSLLLHSFIMFSLLFSLSPACLITSCKDNGIPDEIEDVSVKVDSCIFLLTLDIKSSITDTLQPCVRSLDLFVYDAGALGSLESWKRLENMADSISFKGSKRAKSVVAIANSPRSFNRLAIDRMDSMELVSYYFEEDSPEYPLMSGLCSLLPDAPGHIRLVPLMSRVRLGEISNTMKGFARLEDPRVYLENMNASAEILKNSGFRPSDYIEVLNKKPLPYDIGIFPQHPGAELFCYPNDTPEGTVGSPQTLFVLECEIYGKTCRFPVALNGLGRNKTLNVDISVAGPEHYDYKVY